MAVISADVLALGNREGFAKAVEDIVFAEGLSEREAFFKVNAKHQKHYGRFKYSDIKNFRDTNNRALRMQMVRKKKETLSRA